MGDTRTLIYRRDDNPKRRAKPYPLLKKRRYLARHNVAKHGHENKFALRLLACLKYAIHGDYHYLLSAGKLVVVTNIILLIMRSRPFIQCDVFTSTPTKGNALAVVLDGEGLSDEEMASFAAWTNLAETTFILPPTDSTADYTLRIFTPQREMLFAGHPTLGSCAAWLKFGGKPMQPDIVRQECGVGIVEIEINGRVPAFVAPPTAIQPMPPVNQSDVMEKLNLNSEDIIATAVLDNGPVWQVFELSSADAVLAVDSSLVKWPEEQAIGLIGAYPSGMECDYEVRMLAPSSGMSEDPITGSLNSALAHWFLHREKLQNSTLIGQGTVINRVGRVHIARSSSDPERILIGGETQILIEGTVNI